MTVYAEYVKINFSIIAAANIYENGSSMERKDEEIGVEVIVEKNSGFSCKFAYVDKYILLQSG